MKKLNDIAIKVASIIDHTYLLTESEGCDLKSQILAVKKTAEEAHRLKAFGICVRPSMITTAKETLSSLNSSVKIVTVIGFPNGNLFSSTQKIDELLYAREQGAHEFDTVIKYDDLIKGNLDQVYDDVLEVSKVAADNVLKVILETTYLDSSQIKIATDLCLNAFRDSLNLHNEDYINPRFLKTSTGFAKPTNSKSVGAVLSDVELMYKYSHGKVGLKPSGGISDIQTAINFIKIMHPNFEADFFVDPMKIRIGSSGLLPKCWDVSLDLKSNNSTDY